MNNAIVQHRLVDRVDYRPLPDQVRVNPDGRMPWLQRLLFRAMKRLGATTPLEAVVRTEAVRIDFDDIARAVFECQEDVMRIHQKGAKYLVIGRDRFRDLMKVEAGSSLLAVRFPHDYSAGAFVNGQHQPRMFAGMIVLFVPWIDGLFVMPELPDIVSPGRSSSEGLRAAFKFAEDSRRDKDRE